MTAKKHSLQKWGSATLAIHGHGKHRKAHHAEVTSTPIVHTSNYSFDSTSEVFEFMKAKGQGRVIREHEYGRYGNPPLAGDRAQTRRNRRPNAPSFSRPA